MIKVKIIEPYPPNWIPDVSHQLEQELKDIDPEDIIAITQNKLIGYTIFYKETKSPEETLQS